MMKYRGLVTALGLVTLTTGWAAARAEELSVRVAVEQQDVYVGDSFVFQVQVNGSDEPEAPKMAGLADFDVQFLGGQKNNSESVTIINGRMSRDVRRGYVFSYRLTPKRVGQLQIPSLAIRADGQTVKTDPVEIRASQPEENEDFKLRLTLSKETCYVGEPVILTVTWYISKDVRTPNFTLPLLQDKRFTVIDPEPQNDPRTRYVQVPVAGATVIGETGQGVLDGRSYTTVRFQKVLFPRQAGTLPISAGTVSCSARVGGGSRDPFDRFFGDDVFGARGTYRKFVTPSNSLTLYVRALPAEGQPANFSGLIGTYRIEASATPTCVNVGDPITLTVKVRGADYLKAVELPPLDRQPALARDFKIPAEMAPGKLEGDAKVFTQTIRAQHPGVKEIPPIELSYFDSRTGKYDVAKSKPISLVVRETKVVTARDAEGREAAPVQTELQAWQEGIAHNYEDLGALENQEFGLATVLRSPSWLALGAVPPVVYVLLLGAMTVSRIRQADPAAIKARRAYGELTRRTKAVARTHVKDAPEGFGELLDAARNYLGSKLRLSAAAITWRDVEPRLRERSIDAATLTELKQIFDECEARRYAGAGAGGDDVAAMARRLLAAAEKLEGALR